MERSEAFTTVGAHYDSDHYKSDHYKSDHYKSELTTVGGVTALDTLTSHFTT